MSRQQQLIHHVKDDQRRHSIEGESFPSFGEGEIEKTLGVTKEGRAARARQRSFGGGHNVERRLKSQLTMRAVYFCGALIKKKSHSDCAEYSIDNCLLFRV